MQAATSTNFRNPFALCYSDGIKIFVQLEIALIEIHKKGKKKKIKS